MPQLPIQPKIQGNKKSSGLDVEVGVWQNLKKRWVDNINGGVSMTGGGGGEFGTQSQLNH